MAYRNFQNCTEQEFKTIIYSGNANQRLRLWVNNTEIPDIDEYCEEVSVNGRIFPNGSNTFNINDLISKEVTIIIRDISPSVLDGEIKFSIGILVDEENDIYEDIPMGIYNIQEIPNTDYNKTTLKLRDNSVKLDFPYNAKPLIDENGGSATLKQILYDICEKGGINCKVVSFEGDDKLIGIYDNSINGRVYVNYIAGQCGAIPIIDRDGALDFIYINNLVIHKIPLDLVESYELGEPYQISKVIYESGIIKYEKGTDNNDTMYIDSSNLYINSEEQVQNVLNVVNGFKIDSAETGRILGNPAIDSWDLIQIYGYYDENNNFIADENTIVLTTFANNAYTYTGVSTQSFETTISKEKRETNVSYTSNQTFKKNVKTEIDLINGILRLINTEYLNFLKTASHQNYVEIEDVFANGITKLEITGQMNLLYPSDNLYPSDDLYPLDSYLIIEDENEEIKKYQLGINYLNQNDKYIYTYEFDETTNGYIATAVIQRANNTIEELEAPIFDMPRGNYKIYMESFENLNYNVEYVIHNELTNTLATNTQLATAITQTRNEIDIKASQMVNKETIVADLNVGIKDGQGVIELTGNKIKIKSDKFKLDEDGTITATNGIFNGEINGSAINGSKFTGGTIELYDNEANSQEGASLRFKPARNDESQYLEVNSGGIGFWNENEGVGTLIKANGDVEVANNLTVYGNKNRIVKIKDNKEVLLNAYETATPYFGDIGSNKTNNKGYCKIEIENIFKQTIENDDYKVFIQECDDGKLYVKKYKNYFEVIGTPNLDFDWEIKAIQKGYKDVRLKEFVKGGK